MIEWKDNDSMHQLNFGIDEELVNALDELVDGVVFTNRTQLIRYIFARYIEHSRAKKKHEKSWDELGWSCPITGDPSLNPYLLKKGKNDE